MLTSTKIWMYQDQLDSLFVLAGLMCPRKFSVIRSLIKYLEPGTLKSTATRNQILEDTGIPKRTQYTYIQEFIKIGLIEEWRAPYDKKQCYYRLNLPVAPSALEFYAQSRRKAAKSSKQVPDSTVEEVEVEAEKYPNSPHDEPQSDHSADGSCFPADASDEQENHAARGEIPMTKNKVTDSTGHESSTARLDPEISKILDDLERNGARNSTTRFLTASGFLGLQLASDEKIVIDREGLLRFLLEKNANSIDRFCELLVDFAASAQERMPPSIDLPMSDTIGLHLHHKLSDYPLGRLWLWDLVPQKDGDGRLLPELEIRRSLVLFMKWHRLQSLDDVVRLAAEKHEEELNRERFPREALDESELDLRPGELSCKAIMDRFHDADRSPLDEIVLDDNEMDLFYHCQAKFEREHSHMMNSLFKTSQRNAMVRLLIIVGRQNPELVGYQPERGEMSEPRDYSCC